MKINARQLKRFEPARGTVLQILGSKHVIQFCVGISGVPTTRRKAYARWCKQNDAQLDGFVLLDWDLSPDEVVAFERWLFTEVCRHPKYANVENVKYFPNVNRRYDKQAIYIAWWSPAFC